MSFDINNLRVAVIGLGYVGLPLAVEFGKRYPTVGFDIKAARIAGPRPEGSAGSQPGIGGEGAS